MHSDNSRVYFFKKIQKSKKEFEEKFIGFGEGGPQNCGTVPTVMAINSDGEITDIQCAPI